MFTKSRDMIAFYTQMSDLYRSGVGPVEAIPLAAGHVKNGSVQRAAADLHYAALRGEMLSSVCARHPGVFTSIDTALIAAGEQHGRLDHSFRQLAGLAEREYRAKRRLIFGMAYPVFLLVMAWLLPPLSVFVTEGPEAYLATVGWAAVPFIVVIGGAFVAYKLFRGVTRALYDQVVLLVPVIGPALKSLAVARFSRAMSLVYAASGDLRKSLALAVSAFGNLHLEKLCRGAKWRLDDGATLTQALTGARIFSAEDIASVAVAERSGTLEPMFEVMAQRHEEQADRSIKTLLAVIPVAVFLMVAAYIGYIVVSFYAGYFKQIEQIK